VELHKQPGFTTLGMEVNEENATAIRVKSVDEDGLVGRHNLAQSSRSSKIHAGDLIVEVNGVSGDPAAMLQECKFQQVLILIVARGSSTGSPVPSTVPSPPAGNNTAAFSGSADGGELDRVLAEVTSTQHFKEISAPPASWGRLRPDAQVFVPSSTQASDSAPPAESPDSACQVAQAPPSRETLGEHPAFSLPTSGATEGGAVAEAADGKEEGGLARLLFP